jgi:hypothetical protein
MVMPILAYCIVDPNARLDISQTGVAGSAVESIQRAGLQCVLSRLDSDRVAGLSGRDAVLSFHRVLQDIFRQTAIIPFRFPTTIQEEPELLRFLDEHADGYRESLTRIRDLVQMEIRIAWTPTDHHISVHSATGTDYLRLKQQRQARLTTVAESLRSAVNLLLTDWRERGSRDGSRLFALIDRSAVNRFQDQLAALKIDPEILVRVSGPWPATEFIQGDNGRS